VVLSGLALGIDGAAHRGALEAGGKTLAVLGCGVDIIYPHQHAGLYERLAAEGLLVSEFPLGTKPEGFRFPQRNRIIAGLADGVLVVEAARRSGSLITAQIALDLGREIFAVPGQIDSAKSEGCHWLLQQGAKLVGRVDDVLVELGVSQQEVAGRESPEHPVLDEESRRLFALLEPYPLSRDELLLKSGLEHGRLSEVLLRLQLQGLLEVHPGGRLSRSG
jgi:DNA processing protein